MRPRLQVMPCPVCGDPVPVKLTHRGKPYWQCDPCGVQVFVRRKEGIERFQEKTGVKTPKKDEADNGFWS